MEQLYFNLSIHTKFVDFHNSNKFIDGLDYLNYFVFTEMQENKLSFIKAVEEAITHQQKFILKMNQELTELRRLYSLDQNEEYVKIANEYKKLIEEEKQRLKNFEPQNNYNKLSRL